MNFEYFSLSRIIKSVLCLLGVLLLIGGIWYHRLWVSGPEPVAIDISPLRQDASPFSRTSTDQVVTDSISIMTPPLDSQDELQESLMDLSKWE